MARKQRGKPYEGGDWSIGCAVPHPRPQTAIEAARRAQLVREHYLPYTERRAAETGRRLYAGVADFYRAELAALDTVLAAGAPQKRARHKKASAA